MNSLKGLLILPVLWVNPVLCAETLRPQLQPDLELEEVLVKGRKPTNSSERMTSWLSRLVGEFRYDGYVERRGSDRTEVHGESRCSNLGAPGLVRCLMNVSWQQKPGPGGEEIPGSTSWLTQAVAVYGIYTEPSPGPGQFPAPQYIGHMQVDSGGLAETGKGQLYDDTLIYKAPCADLPGNCQRVVQIEAPQDGKVVRMSVDVRRDSQLEVRYVFQWNRVAKAPAESETPRPVIATLASNDLMPTGTQNWLRRLVGNFQLVHPNAGCVANPPPNFVCPFERTSKHECVGIGGGPGVHCIRDMGWQESRVPTSRVHARFELWGYDPSAGNIVFAWGSPLGMGEVGSMNFSAGKLRGNTFTFTEPCYGDPTCLTSRVTIPPDGQYVQIVGDIGRRGELGTMATKLVRVANEPAASEVSKVRRPSPRRP